MQLFWSTNWVCLTAHLSASEIKQILSKIPIVMVADPLELPEDALKSVDVMVADL